MSSIAGVISTWWAKIYNPVATKCDIPSISLEEKFKHLWAADSILIFFFLCMYFWEKKAFVFLFTLPPPPPPPPNQKPHEIDGMPGACCSLSHL